MRTLSPSELMRYYKYILFWVLPLLFASSCNGLTPGIVKGPIVDPPPETDNTIMTGKVAVNHMTTSLVMKCPAIMSAGSEKPKVINNFVISPGKVNSLQTQVWRRLINMNMIQPVSDKAKSPVFELESEITRLPERANGQVKYSWFMSMKRIADSQKVWSEQIEFGE